MKGQLGLYVVNLSSVGAAWALWGQPGLCGATLPLEQTATITQRAHSWPPTLAVFQKTIAFSLHSQKPEKGRKGLPNRVSTVSAQLSH